jgi:hypothetical protein
VSGIDGWALSKRHDLRNRFSEDALREVFELPAPVERKPQEPATPADEMISLRILSYLDDLQDLHAAAMVNKSFYSAFKKHELTLMRNLVMAGKRKAAYTPNGSVNEMQDIYREEQPVSLKKGTSFPIRRDSTYKSPPAQRPPIETSNDEELYEVTPPTSPVKPTPELHISPTEEEEILWPHQTAANGSRKRSINGVVNNLDPESNAKFLSGDIVHVDKSLVIEGRKHLRDEQDTHLRMPLSVAQTS